MTGWDLGTKCSYLKVRQLCGSTHAPELPVNQAKTLPKDTSLLVSQPRPASFTLHLPRGPLINRACACVCAQSLSCVQFFVTPWTVACQTPLSTQILISGSASRGPNLRQSLSLEIFYGAILNPSCFSWRPHMFLFCGHYTKLKIHSLIVYLHLYIYPNIEPEMVSGFPVESQTSWVTLHCSAVCSIHMMLGIQSRCE